MMSLLCWDTSTLHGNYLDIAAQSDFQKLATLHHPLRSLPYYMPSVYNRSQGANISYNQRHLYYKYVFIIFIVRVHNIHYMIPDARASLSRLVRYGRHQYCRRMYAPTS